MAKKTSYTRDYVLPTAPPETALVVPESQWGTLMNRISECGEPLDWHWAAGWTAIGVAVTSAFSAVTLWASVEFSKKAASGSETVNWPATISFVACIVVAVAAAPLACACLYYATKSAAKEKRLRDIIVEDMTALQEAYRKSASQN